MASRWRRPKTLDTLEEWGVGGRAFGNWVTWFLIGGASYTAYTFIAIPAYAWGYGAIGFYAVPFALITTPLVYLVSTRFWSVAHAHGFVTSAEFTRARFGSRPLALDRGDHRHRGDDALHRGAADRARGGLQDHWHQRASGRCSPRSRSSRSPPSAAVCARRHCSRSPRTSCWSGSCSRRCWWSPCPAVGVRRSMPPQRRFDADQNPVTDTLLSQPGQWTYLTLVDRLGAVDLRVSACADRHPGGQGPQHDQAQRGRAADLLLRPGADGVARYLRHRPGRDPGRRRPRPDWPPEIPATRTRSLR